MVRLVDQCVAAGLTLRENQRYGYKTPPIFRGGKYEVESIFPISLVEHYSVLADMHGQIEDLPDGSRVRVVVVNAPQRKRNGG
jgi:hypothetical protein